MLVQLGYRDEMDRIHSINKALWTKRDALFVKETMEAKYRKNEGDRLRRKKLKHTSSCPTLCPSSSTTTVTTLAPSSSSSIAVKKDTTSGPTLCPSSLTTKKDPTSLQLPLLPRSSSRRSKKPKVTKSVPSPAAVASNNLFPIGTHAADSVLDPSNESNPEPTRIPNDTVSNYHHCELHHYPILTPLTRASPLDEEVSPAISNVSNFLQASPRHDLTPTTNTITSNEVTTPTTLLVVEW